MRNLKKVLALTLAMALVLSLSVTAGAVKFTDEEKITGKYKDAVALMSELSIMNGFPDNTYQPQGELTRAQYLKMLYVVMNRGVDDQAVLYKDVQPFPFYDVRDYDWFNGYVKWGYGRQLIDGYGGGVFKPNGTVTGFEALKMSLTALGYNSEIEGYTGDAWKTQVLNDAQDAGLLLNLETENLSVNLTREAAAQLLHNTLFSQTVRYNTTYIPAKMEKSQTMAYTYYNLYTLRGVVVANEWASVSGSKSLASESRIVAEASNIPKDMEGNNIGTGTYDLPYKAPLDMLGKEVVVYVRYANNYTTRPFDKVYGNMLETSRNIIKTVYAQADIDGVLNNTNSGVNTDLDNYVVNDDYGLDSTYSKVSAATVVVNYNGNVSSTNKILAGSPITFIDYNNDGNYDYIIALSLTYANVTVVSSENKVTAIAGDIGDGDFSGKRILSAVAKSDIYGGADLKVDDRILYFPIGGKQGVIVVTPQKATLTASRSNATIAIISGAEYKESKLDSRVVDLDDILVSDNFNVEKDYYFYNSKVLEGSTGTTSSKVWALVIDSYTTGSGIVKNNQVKLVLQDNTTAVYKLNAIEDVDGNNMTITAVAAGNPKIEAEDKTGTIDTNFNTNVPIQDKIFRVAISEDKESVTLYNVALATAQPDTGASARVSYTKGESVITLTGNSSGSFTGANVLTGSVFFVKNGTDYGAYVGRTLPTPPSTRIDITELRKVDNAGNASLTGTAVRSVLLTGNIPVNAAANKTYGYVLKDPIVKYDGKYYISELVLFNGTDVVTLVGQPGVRSTLQTGTYSESAINSRDTDLSGPSTDSVRIKKGDIIEYTLGADGKLYSIVTLRGASYSNILSTYNAYTAVAVNRAIDIVNPDALAAGVTGTVKVNGDTKYYGVNSDDVTGHGLTNLPSDIGIQKGYYIQAIVKAGVATHIWVLEHKNAERVQDKINAGNPGLSAPTFADQIIVSEDGKVGIFGTIDSGYSLVGYSPITVTDVTNAKVVDFDVPQALSSNMAASSALAYGGGTPWAPMTITSGAANRLWLYNSTTDAFSYIDVKTACDDATSLNGVLAIMALSGTSSAVSGAQLTAADVTGHFTGTLPLAAYSTAIQGTAAADLNTSAKIQAIADTAVTKAMIAGWIKDAYEAATWTLADSAKTVAISGIALNTSIGTLSVAASPSSAGQFTVILDTVSIDGSPDPATAAGLASSSAVNLQGTTPAVQVAGTLAAATVLDANANTGEVIVFNFTVKYHDQTATGSISITVPA